MNIDRSNSLPSSTPYLKLVLPPCPCPSLILRNRLVALPQYLGSPRFNVPDVLTFIA